MAATVAELERQVAQLTVTQAALLANVQQHEDEAKFIWKAIDTAWVLQCALLVFVMQVSGCGCLVKRVCVVWLGSSSHTFLIA